MVPRHDRVRVLRSVSDVGSHELSCACAAGDPGLVNEAPRKSSYAKASEDDLAYTRSGAGRVRRARVVPWVCVARRHATPRVFTRPVPNRFSRPGTRGVVERVRFRTLASWTMDFRGRTAIDGFSLWGLAPCPIRRFYGRSFRCSGLCGFTPRKQLYRVYPKHRYDLIPSICVPHVSKFRTSQKPPVCGRRDYR